ncbi:MAG: hypothetical protein WD226_05295 [Planctomycetota bacterium]
MSRPPASVPWYAWLSPFAMLGAVIGGVAWVMSGPAGLFGYVFMALFGAAIGWIVVSVLWPARADRTCPRCGSERLERLDVSTTVGIRCAACGFEDDSKSSWLLAEDEGPPLESLVLRQRRPGTARTRRHPASGALQPKADDPVRG